MKVELVLTDMIDQGEEEISTMASPLDIALNVYVGEKSLEEQLSNKKLFLDSMDIVKYWHEQLDIEDEDFDANVDNLINNYDHIMDMVEFIRFNFQDKDVIEYIKNNPSLKGKKLVISEALDITEFEKLLYLMDKYSVLNCDIYISLVGNVNYISLNDCYKTMSKVKERANEIASLGLSPLETAMFVYDQVRNRVYKYEDDNESAFKSRDLTEVMFGDKIVCAGFANELYALLYYLGYKNYYVDYTAKEGNGHARNIVYIKDDKYDVDGTYYVDATWDSKRSEDSNAYLLTYRNFALTRDEMMKRDKGELTERFMERFTPSIYDEVKELFDERRTLPIMGYGVTINRILRFANEETFSVENVLSYCAGNDAAFNKEEFYKSFKTAINKFNRKIPAETMIMALDKVREVEHKMDPEWYPYTINDMYSAFVNSGWTFSDIHLNKAQRTLINVFGVEPPLLSAEDNYINYAMEIGLIDKLKPVKDDQLKRVRKDDSNK